MSTREDVKTFFGLPLDFSMLELEPETDADLVRYFCTPENAEIIGWGSCGTHFVLLPGDEAVYCVEPELAEEGTFVLPVGADFLEDNAANTWPGCEEGFKSGDASLALLAETFGVQPKDPFDRVKALQAAFDPSVLEFSDEYYDTLGLENPRHPEEQDINTGCDVAATQVIMMKKEDTREKSQDHRLENHPG